MAWDEGSLRVQVGALKAGASLIATAGGTVELAEGQVRDADSVADFGGEAAGEAFASACTRGASALGSIAEALGGLSTNTAAAAAGYVLTDEGAIPSEFGSALSRHGIAP